MFWAMKRMELDYYGYCPFLNKISFLYALLQMAYNHVAGVELPIKDDYPLKIVLDE